jgi:quinoprotein glucose dehydrogenase
MRRLLVGTFLILAAASIAAQKDGDWPLHNLDLQNSRYSSLTDINTSNGGSLVQKWQLDLPKPASLGAATPIAVDGIMYVNSGATLFAVDGATGQIRWTASAAEEFPSGGRGPAFGDGRVYAVGRSIIAAFDAKTGKPIESFGNRGMLHAARAALQLKDPGKYAADFDPESLGYLIVGTPTYANGTLFVGLAVSDNVIPGGLVAAFDAATGRAKWVFRTIPQGPQDDGWEVAKDTWSAPQRYGGGIWTQPAVDVALNAVYFNVANPSPNYDGSSRKGANLFTNSIVALDATTGKLKWHFQAIHHDIWDWDLMTGPTLFDVTINGKAVKALASLAKTCYVYALDRETGKPLFPIVETVVPTKTDMPGDEVYPTQPIPYTARFVPQTPFCATYPPNIDPELAAQVRPMFTPYSVNEFIIQSPGLMGGPNRGSSSFSPKTGLLYVTGKNDAWSAKLKPIGFSQHPTARGPQGGVGHSQGFVGLGKTGVKPTQNIAAYNPATGELAWVTELPGVTNGGSLVTAGDVVFEAIGREFYALDAKSGRKLTQVSMKVVASSTPLTYRAGGKQFVAIASGPSVIAIGLP